MLIALLIGFAAGALMTNGLPHFVKGITGQTHMTPFGQPSSALTNVIWGWLNFVVGGTLWGSLSSEYHGIGIMAACLGALVCAAILANYWSEHLDKNQKPPQG